MVHYDVIAVQYIQFDLDERGRFLIGVRQVHFGIAFKSYIKSRKRRRRRRRMSCPVSARAISIIDEGR